MDVSGCTLVQHLAPRAQGDEGQWWRQPQPCAARKMGLVLRAVPTPRPQAHLFSHASTAGSPASTACRTSCTFSSSQLMVAGSFQRKWDLPRYRLTSWLRAGGWLWAVGPVRPPRAQAPRARRCLWASRACWRPGGERGCPEGAADKGKGPRGRAHRHLLLCSVLTKNKFLDQNLNTRRTQTPVRTDTGEPAPVS